MRISRVFVLGALSTLTTTGMFAAYGTTNRLEIYLRDRSGDNCQAVTAVWAVIQNREGTSIPASKDKNDPCHWTLDTQSERFNTDLIHFSLRIRGVARTGCAKPIWDDALKVAKIYFGFFKPVQQITIMPTPKIKLPYARELSGSESYIPCVETAELPFEEGDARWTIPDVAFNDETVRLRFFESTKDLCGMLVNSLPAVKKAAKKADGHIEIKRSDVVDALALQRVVDRCQVPSLSAAAIEISDKSMRQRGLQSLSVTVKK